MIVISLAVGLTGVRNLYLLATEGQTIPAQIVDEVVLKNSAQSTNTTLHLAIVYEYQVNHQTYRNQASVKPEFFDKASLGQPYPVTILPSNPVIHRLGKVSLEDARSDVTTLVGASVCILFIVLAGWAAFEASARAQRKLLEEGHAISGTIVEVKRWSVRHISFSIYAYRFTLTVEYEVAPGQKSRRVGHTPMLAANERAPSVGDSTFVIGEGPELKFARVLDELGYVSRD